ncbi:FtsX-like permease family protein [Planctomycetota bacterium]
MKRSLICLVLLMVFSVFTGAEDFDYKTYLEATDANREYLFNLLDKLAGFKKGSRVTGYLGCQEAAQTIEKELKAVLGEDNVQKDIFTVPVPVQKEAFIKIDEDKINLFCMWPNIVRVPSIPEGFTGPVVYVGAGYFEQMDRKPIADSIVVMDFDCEERFLEAVKLGARAIVFVPSDVLADNDRYEAALKILKNNMDVPRFYLDHDELARLYKTRARKTPEALRANQQSYDTDTDLKNQYHCRQAFALFGGAQPMEGLIKSVMLWEKKEAVNFYGIIKGRGFKGFSAKVLAIEAEDEFTTIKLAPEVSLPPINNFGDKVFFTSGSQKGKRFEVHDHDKHSIKVKGKLDGVAGDEFMIRMDFEEVKVEPKTYDKGAFEKIQIKTSGEGLTTSHTSVLIDAEADFLNQRTIAALKISILILLGVSILVHAALIIKAKQKSLYVKTLFASLVIIPVLIGIFIGVNIKSAEKHTSGNLFVRFESGALASVPENPFLITNIDNDRIYLEGNFKDRFETGDSYRLERKLTTFTDSDVSGLEVKKGVTAVNFDTGKLRNHPDNPFLVTEKDDQSLTVIGDLEASFASGDSFRLEDKGAMLLMASYDTMSVVPELAPGAEQTGGVVALINLAKVFKANPPARNVIFAAVSGRFQGLSGVREFATKHCWEGHKDVVLKNGDDYVPLKFDMAFGIDLNSHGSQLGLCPQSNSPAYAQLKYQPGNYDELKKAMGSYAEEYTKITGEPCMFENMQNAIDIALNEKMAFNQPMFLYHMAQTGSRAAVISSLYTNREREDTPFDTLDNMNRDNLFAQIRDLTAIMAQCIGDPAFFSKAPAKKVADAAVMIDGVTYFFDQDRNFMPQTPVPDTLVRLVREEVYEPSFCGVRYGSFQFSDRKGKFRFYGFPEYWANLRAFKMNAKTGELMYATDFGKNGHKTYPIKLKPNYEHDKTTIVVLFEAKGVGVYDLFDPRFFKVITNLEFINSDNVVPESWGMSFGLTGGRFPYATIYTDENERIKVLGRRGVFGIQYLAPGNEPFSDLPANSRKPAAEGRGIPLVGRENLRLTAYDVAKSMSILNDYRIGVLNTYGIRDKELEKLTEFSRDALAEAEKAKALHDYTGYQKHLHGAFQAASKVYPAILSTTNDSLKGVIFYFALLIPFAYFLERLMFGFAQILKQLFAVCVIFLLVFFIFRWIHPVFQITETPYIILLAFVLLALSCFVTVFLVRKFNNQMGELRRKASKVHHSDVQRLGATVAAIRLGISNMRNRKIRTTLTTATLVLLTFIVLSFVSISSRSDFYKISISDQPIYDGFLVRDRGWGELDQEIYNSIELEFGGQSDTLALSPRYWYFEGKTSANVTEALNLNIFLSAKGTKFEVKGVLGIGAAEDKVTNISRYLKHGAWFEHTAADTNALIIPSFMAEKLGLSEEEQAEVDGTSRKWMLKVYGRSYWIKGIMDSNRFNNLVDIDNEQLTPTDPSDREMGGRGGSVSQEIQQMRAAQTTITSIKPAKHLSPEFVVFMNPKVVKKFGGKLRSLAVVCKDIGEDNYVSRVSDFLKRVGIMIFVSNRGESKAFTPKMSTGMQGFANILVPLIIASMIVLNTMMGAVHERHQEIRTYSSVGLAPKHIGALFLAESIVYSVVGGVSGFLIAQVLAKMVHYFGLLGSAGIELNYSSMATVLSIMLVMAVVMLSTIYPARMASNLSVPDVTRRWKLVPPETDEWVFDFPFTVPQKGVEGIIVFLNNYFEGYKEESIGAFYTDNVLLSKNDTEFGQGFSIKMRIWIAPFDMGVSQMTELLFSPTEDSGIMKIVVDIDRVAGEHKAWVRLNKGFLSELRKQFLIWRTISPVIKTDYTEQGREMLAV